MAWRQLWKVVLLGMNLLVASTALASTTININTADAETLTQHIVGVGPKKAEAIVAYRKAHGPFKSVQELSKVKGIGKRLIERNQHILTTSSAARNIDEYGVIAQKTH